MSKCACKLEKTKIHTKSSSFTAHNNISKPKSNPKWESPFSTEHWHCNINIYYLIDLMRQSISNTRLAPVREVFPVVSTFQNTECKCPRSPDQFLNYTHYRQIDKASWTHSTTREMMPNQKIKTGMQ